MRQTQPKSQSFSEIKAEFHESEKARDHYKALAEAREFTLDTILKPAHEITVASGIVTDMVGEVRAYGRKVGQNEKYQISIARLLRLDEFIAGCSKYSDHAYRLRSMLNKSIWERDQLQEENTKLKSQLEAINKAWDAE